MEKKKKRRAGRGGIIRERLCDALDIPPDTLPRTGMVEIRGRNSVIVKEGGKILSYAPESITVELNGGEVTVAGERLSCTTYCYGIVRIDGFVRSVSFEER